MRISTPRNCNTRLNDRQYSVQHCRSALQCTTLINGAEVLLMSYGSQEMLLLLGHVQAYSQLVTEPLSSDWKAFVFCETVSFPPEV